MKTPADPVRDYLSAVEREACALPADRRQELLADLAEHIEVTRAERPHATISKVLAELGDPRTIAATALTEAGNGTAAASTSRSDGAPARRGKVHPLVPLLMLPLTMAFVMVFPAQPGPLICFLFRITGVIFLCTSAHWTAVQKTTGVLLAAVVPTAIIATANLSGGGPTAGTPAFLTNLAVLALMAGTAAWLWRARRV
ncbi:HAAS signaling domain-containing protein [Streptomyces sp. WZ-12]|uniref:HAAS signaling domain-containing protein n=1 Tax=Streptomyces sp. WZ-12 TaxID=3030210 RepID=UPI0023815A88|nr:hypothetical protein [Streptomyces sp. WZ-12]